MRNKTQARVLSLVLALVMLLPLISIPTFAEETSDPTISIDFENKTDVFEAINDHNNSPYSAQLVTATKDAETHGTVFQMSAAPVEREEDIYLFTGSWGGSLYRFNLSPEALSDALEAGVISGTATGVDKHCTGEKTVENATINKDPSVAYGSLVKCSEGYWIVTAEVLKTVDIANGACRGNISSPAMLKHGSLTGDGDYIVVSMDIYLSADFLSNGLQGRMQASDGKYFELFKIERKMNGASAPSTATLTRRDNSNITAGTTKSLTVDAWHRLDVVINRESAIQTVYADGQYAFQAKYGTPPTMPFAFKANTLQLEVGRKGNKYDYVGYVQADNVSIAITNDLPGSVPNASYSFDGVAMGDVAASYASDATIVNVADRGGVLQFPMTADGYDAKINADLYLMKNDNNINNAFPIDVDDINNGVEDGKLLGAVTVSGATIELPEAGWVINETGFNTKVGGDSAYKDYYLVVPAVAKAKCGGNFNTPVKFKHDQLDSNGAFWSASFDLYVSPDFKNDTGLQGRAVFNGGAVTTKECRAELFKLYTSGGKVYLTKHDNASRNETAGNGDGINQYGNDGTEPHELARDAWYRIDIVIDRATTEQFLFIDGMFAFRALSVDNSSDGKLNFKDDAAAYLAKVSYKAICDVHLSNSGHVITPTVQTPMVAIANNFQFERTRNSVPSQLGGYIQMDNLSITVGDELPEVKLDYDFEGVKFGNGGTFGDRYYASGFARTGKSAIQFKMPNVVDELGSRVWKRWLDGNDYSWYLPLPALSYKSEEMNRFVYEVDYFVEAGSNGRLQAQFQTATANANGTGERKSYEWIDLYQIQLNGTSAQIKFEQNTAHEKLAQTKTILTGRWFNIALAIDLVAGEYDLYLDGELLFADLPLYRTGDRLTEISVASSSVTVGKSNKTTSNGTFYLDNVRLFAGDKPTMAPTGEGVETFDDMIYSVNKQAGAGEMPALSKLVQVSEGNLALRLEMKPSTAADTYTLLAEKDGKSTKAGFAWTEGDPATATLDGSPIELTYDEVAKHYKYTDANGDAWCVVTADVAAASIGDGNVDKRLRTTHEKFSYTTQDKVVLSADYFIEEGSTGTIQSQFDRYWLGEDEKQNLFLYDIHMDTGRVDSNGLYLEIGEWNNIKVVIDLKNGGFDIYVNDVFSHHKDSGAELSFGGDANHSWPLAKVARQVNHRATPNKGALLIDNVSISTEALATSETFGDKFLSDDVFLPFATDSLMEIVDGASIRLKELSGLRFATLVDEAALESEILSRLPEGSTAEIVKKGTLIAPESYYNAAAAFTHADLEALGTATPYLDVEFGGLYFGGAKAAGLPEGDYMVGSIVKIKEKNLDRGFAAAGYMELNVNGTSYMIYTDVVVRCATDVAQAYYNDYLDEKVALTENEVKILKDTFHVVDPA